MKTEWMYAIGTVIIVFLIIKRVRSLHKAQDLLLVIKHAQHMSIISVMLCIITSSKIIYDLIINNQGLFESFRNIFLATLFLWLAVSFYNNYKITKNGLILANFPYKWEDIMQWQLQNNTLMLQLSDSSMRQKGKYSIAKIPIHQNQKAEVEKHLSKLISNKKAVK
jgi:hypothetical protein